MNNLSKCCGARLDPFIQGGFVCTNCGSPCEVVEKQELPASGLLSDLVDNIYSRQHYPNEIGHEKGIRAVSEQAFKEGCIAQQAKTSAEKNREIKYWQNEAITISFGVQQLNKEIAGLEAEIENRKQIAEDWLGDIARLNNCLTDKEADHQAKLEKAFQEIEKNMKQGSETSSLISNCLVITKDHWNFIKAQAISKDK